MNNRYVGAVALIPLLVMIFLGGWPLRITVLLLALRALHEFYTVISKKGLKPDYVLGYATLLVYYGLLLFTADASRHLGSILALAAALGFIMLIFRKDFHFEDMSVTIVGFIYASVLFGYLILIHDLPNGRYLVYSVFIISWVCDTMAYYTGRLFGKHKLIERVSPKKTIEGAIGGLAGGALGSFALGMAVQNITGIAPVHFLIMGFLGAILGQIGDLAASSIKRYTGEKDYPKIIPGHGGVLDRFDSIIFVSLLVFLYSRYIL